MFLPRYFGGFVIEFFGSYFYRYPIRRVRPVTFGYLDEPFLNIYEALVADYPKVHATGKSFFSKTDALTAAVFEAIERFSYEEFFPEVAVEASYKDARGEGTLDIFSLAGFSDEQKGKDESL